MAFERHAENNEERLRERVKSQVKRFGLPDSEVDHVADEILDAWAKLALAPSGTGPAKPQTVLHGLVVNRCKMALRRLVRNRERDRKYGEAVPQNDESMRRDIPLRVDVREALANLSPHEQRLCDALARGVSRREIAAALGLTRHRMLAMIEGIRTRFAAQGLAEWLKE